MDWLKENFYDFFAFYWRDSNFAMDKDLALYDLEVLSFDKYAHTVNFIASFNGG